MSGVFVCYRRHAAVEHAAGRLKADLIAAFGEDAVFMDIDSVGPGEDWMQAIEDALSVCDVLLAVIHPGWVEDDRLTGREDVLRMEIESALDREMLVVPLLVNDAAAPTQAELPDSLKVLARRKALPLRHETWQSDLSPLLDAVRSAERKAAEKEEERIASEQAKSERKAAEKAKRESDAEAERKAAKKAKRESDGAAKKLPSDERLAEYARRLTSEWSARLVSREKGHVVIELQLSTNQHTLEFKEKAWDSPYEFFLDGRESKSVSVGNWKNVSDVNAEDIQALEEDLAGTNIHVYELKDGPFTPPDSLHRGDVGLPKRQGSRCHMPRRP